ncbi:MAG: hypothetical protein LBG71_06900 [Clostridiales Family XIII bacterium]|jgi:hypothetical protein|nr:hypothetical protein [Clostridiales Family XIII bacterium]
MAKPKQMIWNYIVDGVPHTFVLDILKNDRTLIVDGRIKLQRRLTLMESFTEGTFPFQLDGREMLLISSHYGSHIVIDGKSLSDGREYVPFPKWSCIFLLPAIFLIILGGALGGMCGMVAFAVCVRVAKNSALHKAARIACCIAIMLASWVVYFVLAYAIITSFA